MTTVTVKYAVKVRDNADYEFVHTFVHTTTPDQLTSNNIALLQQLMQTYRFDMLRAAPFRCVNCDALAQLLFNLPVAYLTEDDPIVFDCALPFCRSAICEKDVHERIQKTSRNVGKGAGLTRNMANARNPSLERIQDNEHSDITACVTCGDTKHLRKCNGCKLVRC